MHLAIFSIEVFHRNVTTQLALANASVVAIHISLNDYTVIPDFLKDDFYKY